MRSGIYTRLAIIQGIHNTVYVWSYYGWAIYLAASGKNRLCWVSSGLASSLIFLVIVYFYASTSELIFIVQVIELAWVLTSYINADEDNMIL